MSSPWTEHVGDLKSKSKDELHEILKRQEKILSNRRILQILPDKGKKIADFAERVRLAISDADEEEQKQKMLFSVGTDLQSKYKQAFSSKQHGVHNILGTSGETRSGEDAAGGVIQVMDTSPFSADGQQNETVNKQQDQSDSRVTVVTAKTSSAMIENNLVQDLERVRLSETSSKGGSKDTLDNARDNLFFRKQPPIKPHYLEVLEKTERDAVHMKQKFKPNQLSARLEHSPPGSQSPGKSPGGSSPLSTQAKRERDRKHLDDITAAKLPPLHHDPARLLSLEESAGLLTEQTKKHQELQSKLAAEKLSKGIKASMVIYNSDSGPMAAYREVHEDEMQPSSEED